LLAKRRLRCTTLEKSGRRAGAVHHWRGLLEIRADPESPYYDKKFETAKTIIVYCVAGGRSALAGRCSRIPQKIRPISAIMRRSIWFLQTQKIPAL
jgi:hypothetical protein